MKKLVMLVAVTVMSACSAWAIDYKSIIIPQTNAPVKITSYKAEFAEGNRYVDRGIEHSVKYKNTGSKRIEAIEFGLLAFDVWNEYLDKTMGISIKANDPGDSEKGTWTSSTYASFSFLTGLAYVSKIRYSDGTIWKADTSEIKTEIMKIQKDFDIKELDSKPPKPK